MNTQTELPGDWDITDPDTWNLTATVDAHMGYHKTGMIVRELRTNTLSARDLDDAGDIEPTEEHAQWWADVLQGIMAGWEAEQEASPEELDAALTALGYRIDPRDNGEDMRLYNLAADYGDTLEMQAIGGRKLAAALKAAKQAAR